MRILLWSDFFPPYVGGVERSAALLLPELLKRGIELTIVTPHHYLALPDEELWQGIPLYRFDFITALEKGDLATWGKEQRRLRQLMDQVQPDLIHIFAIGPSMMACLQLLRQRPTPVITSMVAMEQNPHTDYQPDSATAKALRASTWVVTVSEAIRDQTVAYLPDLEARISPILYGYPTPPVAPKPLAAPPRLLFVGRHVEQKGGEFAIAAFAKLYQRYPDARLIMAGDGPLRAAWQQLASPMGEQVEFIGWTEPGQIYALMNSATMVLMPSRWEGLPLVSLESGFMARPVIASRIPGMSESILDGETGILFDPGDIDGLADAIAALLDDPAKATAMGLAARARVEHYFGFQRYVDEHITLYQQIMENV